MLVLRAGRLAGLSARCAAAGRLALTVYVGQTVVYVLLFTGVGLGLGGRVSVVGQTAIALGMAVATLLVAPWWLRRFRQGPLEWLLRGVTYGERGPLRRGGPRADEQQAGAVSPAGAGSGPTAGGRARARCR